MIAGSIWFICTLIMIQKKLRSDGWGFFDDWFIVAMSSTTILIFSLMFFLLP